MATLAELSGLQRDVGSGLRDRVTMACLIVAESIRTESAGTANHANRLLWARSVFNDPATVGGAMVWAVLAQNAGATVAQITGATDGQVQAAVAAAVDVFAQ